jgi:hypothetical protein
MCIKKFINRSVRITFGFAIVTLAASCTLFAGETLTLKNGTTTVTCSTSGPAVAGCTYSGGVLSYNGAVGKWSVNVVTGEGYPATGSATDPILDLDSIDSTSAYTPGKLTISFTETGFTLNPLFTAAAIGGTISGEGNYGSFGASYGTPGTTIPGSTYTTPTGTGPGAKAFSFNSAPLTAHPTSPYALTLNAVINGSTSKYGPSADSFDFNLEATPEPTLYGVLAIGVLAALYAAHRRKQVKA